METMSADLIHVGFCTLIDDVVVKCFLVFDNRFSRGFGNPSFRRLSKNSDGYSVTYANVSNIS